ncbi:uncharacterized protein LOC143917359 [Arctopsyche grandis]|uniref:uncharacterized protein LOC143917359 n=1 Tax=Arctopsyche grandis TaxID=121162 RepID=UPI00406D86A9
MEKFAKEQQLKKPTTVRVYDNIMTQQKNSTKMFMDMERLKRLVLSMSFALISALIAPSDARVAGKIGIYSNNYSGRSTTGINEEIIWVSIGMGITIAILITIALCYILREKCNKRRDYYANA